MEDGEVQEEHENETQIKFLIDKIRSEKLNAGQIPSYKRSGTDILDESSAVRRNKKAEAANKCFRPKAHASACFNCGATDHGVRECGMPRNNARIQRARKKNGNRSERYHTDSEQRFGHLQPGKISSKTRHALGYSRSELPFMFYRMRIMGYPPAWLKEAEVKSSGMALFNADGTEVLRSDEEEGDLDAFLYDVNKIVDFPGFNKDPGDKFYDDYKHHNVPRFQQQDSKENFIKSLGDNVIKGYKRRKLKDLPATQEETARKESETIKEQAPITDMDLENSNQEPPLPPGKPLLEKPPPLLTPTKSKQESPRSPTLEDLQEQQAKLLQQLDSSMSSNPLESSVGDYESTTDNCSHTYRLNASKMQLDPPHSHHAAITPIKASFEGTPLLKFSVYDKLPIGDNFKVGVSDVINFENLPDSTGNFLRMKSVLRGVREVMVRLQRDNDDENASAMPQGQSDFSTH